MRLSGSAPPSGLSLPPCGGLLPRCCASRRRSCCWCSLFLIRNILGILRRFRYYYFTIKEQSRYGSSSSPCWRCCGSYHRMLPQQHPLNEQIGDKKKSVYTFAPKKQKKISFSRLLKNSTKNNTRVTLVMMMMMMMYSYYCKS